MALQHAGPLARGVRLVRRGGGGALGPLHIGLQGRVFGQGRPVRMRHGAAHGARLAVAQTQRHDTGLVVVERTAQRRRLEVQRVRPLVRGPVRLLRRPQRFAQPSDRGRLV